MCLIAFGFEGGIGNSIRREGRKGVMAMKAEGGRGGCEDKGMAAIPLRNGVFFILFLKKPFIGGRSVECVPAKDSQIGSLIESSC